MSCSIETTEIKSWRAVKLCKAAINVTIRPTKGADIGRFADRASGIDGLTPRISLRATLRSVGHA